MKIVFYDTIRKINFSYIDKLKTTDKNIELLDVYIYENGKHLNHIDIIGREAEILRFFLTEAEKAKTTIDEFTDILPELFASLLRFLFNLEGNLFINPIENITSYNDFMNLVSTVFNCVNEDGVKEFKKLNPSNDKLIEVLQFINLELETGKEAVESIDDTMKRNGLDKILFKDNKTKATMIIALPSVDKETGVMLKPYFEYLITYEYSKDHKAIYTFILESGDNDKTEISGFNTNIVRLYHPITPRSKIYYVTQDETRRDLLSYTGIRNLEKHSSIILENSSTGEQIDLSRQSSDLFTNEHSVTSLFYEGDLPEIIDKFKKGREFTIEYDSMLYSDRDVHKSVRVSRTLSRKQIKQYHQIRKVETPLYPGEHLDLTVTEDEVIKKKPDGFGGIVAVIPGSSMNPNDIEDMIGDMIQDTLDERNASKLSNEKRKLPMISSEYEIVDVITLGTD